MLFNRAYEPYRNPQPAKEQAHQCMREMVALRPSVKRRSIARRTPALILFGCHELIDNFLETSVHTN